MSTNTTSTGLKTPSLNERAGTALHDEFLRGAVRYTTDRLRVRKQESAESLDDWESWRERGREIRRHTIENLDFYLDLFTRNMEQAGGRVHFAANALEAQTIVLEIAKKSGAKLVAKSKS